MIRRGLGRKWNRVAEVATVPPDATQDTARQTFIPSLRCGTAYPLDAHDKERANLGTVSRAYVIYTEPADDIKTNMRLILSMDYRIHSVTPWPDNDEPPDFLEIIIERGA